MLNKSNLSHLRMLYVPPIQTKGLNACSRDHIALRDPCGTHRGAASNASTAQSFGMGESAEDLDVEICLLRCATFNMLGDMPTHLSIAQVHMQQKDAALVAA